MFSKLQELLEKLAFEVGAARPGSDDGQFAVIDALILLRNATASEPKLAAFHTIAHESVPWMMSVMESGQPFNSETIQKLQGILGDLRRLADQARKEGASQQTGASGEVALPPEAPLVMSIQADGDILREYVNEAQEHLENIEQGVLKLEVKPDDDEVLNTVFRAFHTFKGGAGFLNLVPINQLAHNFESLLDLARRKELTIDRTIGEIILEGGDLLKKFVAEMRLQLAGSKQPASFTLPTQPLIARVRKLLESPVRSDQPKVSAPVQAVAPPPPQPIPTPAKAGAPVALSGTVQDGSTPTQVPENRPPQAAPPSVPTKVSATGAPGAASSTSDASVRAAVKVDTNKLDSLVDLVGELVIAQSFVAQHPEVRGIANQFFTRSMAQLNRITKELQRTAMAMRMVPVGSSFQKMTRVVRDLAAKQQKQVQLILSGEDTELDRTIVEEIADPLLHMIRNSVDHGIEKPDVRVARGKPGQGVIHLRAFHRGGNVVIQIEDDGNGLNRDRILAKAVEKGLAPANPELADADIFQLIFAPGFSTAEVVTDVSGRGVGMDVVKRNIEKLQGKVEIESHPGQGTTFTIFLPLTLAIIEALVVSVGDQRFIIPALSVRESFQLTPRMLSTVYQRGEMVKVRDRLIPLLRLHEYFNITPRSTNPAEGIVIVLEAGRATRCLLVDQLLHKQEVVIKSLGEALKRNPALAGAAILGDGRVGLILDVNALVELKHTPLPMAA